MRYSEFKTSLIEKATFNNIPVLGEFELTSTCNFKCSMCYVHLLKKNNDLDTNTWKSIFKQAANNSLLFATLTGGEALNRPDFNELYEYLFDLGVKITVFTNGSILTKDLLNLLKRKNLTI